MKVQTTVAIVAAIVLSVCLAGIVVIVVWRKWKQRQIKRTKARPQQTVWQEGINKERELKDLEHKLRVAELKNTLKRGDWYRDVTWPLHAIIAAMRDAGHEPSEAEVDRIAMRLIDDANRGAPQQSQQDEEAPTSQQGGFFGAAEAALKRRIANRGTKKDFPPGYEHEDEEDSATAQQKEGASWKR